MIQILRFDIWHLSSNRIFSQILSYYSHCRRHSQLLHKGLCAGQNRNIFTYWPNRISEGWGWHLWWATMFRNYPFLTLSQFSWSIVPTYWQLNIYGVNSIIFPIGDRGILSGKPNCNTLRSLDKRLNILTHVVNHGIMVHKIYALFYRRQYMFSSHSFRPRAFKCVRAQLDPRCYAYLTKALVRLIWSAGCAQYGWISGNVSRPCDTVIMSTGQIYLAMTYSDADWEPSAQSGQSFGLCFLLSRLVSFAWTVQGQRQIQRFHVPLTLCM